MNTKHQEPAGDDKKAGATAVIDGKGNPVTATVDNKAQKMTTTDDGEEENISGTGNAKHEGHATTDNQQRMEIPIIIDLAGIPMIRSLMEIINKEATSSTHDSHSYQDTTIPATDAPNLDIEGDAPTTNTSQGMREGGTDNVGGAEDAAAMGAGNGDHDYEVIGDNVVANIRGQVLYHEMMKGGFTSGIGGSYDIRKLRQWGKEAFVRFATDRQNLTYKEMFGQLMEAVRRNDALENL